MLKPSKHSLFYEAIEFAETRKFKELKGNVVKLARKPRIWKVNVTITFIENGVKEAIHVSFTPDGTCTLNGLSPHINQELHQYLVNCPPVKSINVCAKIMTEGGK